MTSAESLTSRYAIQPANAQTTASVATAGRRPMEKLLRKHGGVVERSACDGSAGGEIREQQAPGSRDAEDRRQRVRRVGVERTRRSREPRETADAKTHQQHGASGQQIDEPGGIAGQAEDQRNGQRSAECWAPWRKPIAPAFLPGRAHRHAGHNSRLAPIGAYTLPSVLDVTAQTCALCC